MQKKETIVMNKALAITAAALALTLTACGGRRDGFSDAAGAMNGGRARKDAQTESRYEQMLENARVHDADGFLLDGENSSYPTL